MRSESPDVPPAQTDPEAVGPEQRRGFFMTLFAFLMWGLLPPYWKALGHVYAVEVLAHRIVWSLVLAVIVLALSGRLAELRGAWRGPRTACMFVLSAALLGVNWGLYVWGVQAGRVVECSMGYFMAPLANAAIGAVFLRERLRRLQVVAVGLAGAAVFYLAAVYGVFPWLGVALTTTFGFYGLLRKLHPLEGLPSMAVETAILTVPACIYLALRASATSVPPWSYDGRTIALLIGAGVVTGLPLMLYGYGIRRLRLTTIGFVQYVSPTTMFLLGVILYREPFSVHSAISFGLIWAGLALYTADAARRSFAARR